MPKYYFRLNADGSYASGTGCGNEIASERTMARAFIVNSVKFWAEEYGVKGFRFDLMGSLDTDTMKAVKAACYSVDPEIVVYGEPWTLSSALDTTKYAQATTANVYSKLYDCGHDGQVYYFFDVPLATTKFKLLRCSSDYATCWGEIGEVTSIVPSVIYFVNTESYSSVPSTGNASASKPDAYLMGAVLSAYLTCNSSTDNGYGAVTGASSLTSTWYNNYAGDVNGTLSSVTITDYAKSSSNGGTYSGTKTESVSVARKWEGLSIMATNSGNWVGAKAVVSPATNDSSSTLVLGGIAGVAVLAAGGYFFVRKKKTI